MNFDDSVSLRNLFDIIFKYFNFIDFFYRLKSFNFCKLIF